MLQHIMEFLRRRREYARIRAMDTPPGGQAICRAWSQLCRMRPKSPSEVVTIELAGRPITGPHSDLIEVFDEVFLQGTYQTALPGPEPFILDCGANLGLATLFFHFQYPKARITAFEPSPAIQSHIKSNLAGLERVSLVSAACGREAGHVNFHVVGGHSTGSSATIKWPDATATVSVPVVRVSDYVTEKVALLKLDVEGAEWDVMQDLKATGRLALVERFIVEYHHHLKSDWKLSQFLMFFEDAGFQYNIVGWRKPRQRFDLTWQPLMLYAWKATE